MTLEELKCLAALEDTGLMKPEVQKAAGLSSQATQAALDQLCYDGMIRRRWDDQYSISDNGRIVLKASRKLLV